MGRRSCISVFLALSLLSNGFCLPPSFLRLKRQSTDSENEVASKDPNLSLSTVNYDLPPPIPYNYDEDDDDDFDLPQTYPSSGGGSNVFSLLKLVTGLLSGSSGSSSQSVSQSDKTSEEPAPSPLWTLKLDILRALLQFGTSILGIASSAVFSSSSG